MIRQIMFKRIHSPIPWLLDVRGNMSRNAQAGVVFEVLFVASFFALAALSGCRHQASSGSTGAPPLPSHSRRIADANHVVVTNSFEHPGFNTNAARTGIRSKFYSGV
jgi:hypothetical protein